MKIVGVSPAHFYEIWNKLLPQHRVEYELSTPHFFIRHLDVLIVRDDCAQYINFPGELNLNGSPVSVAMLQRVSCGTWPPSEVTNG